MRTFQTFSLRMATVAVIAASCAFISGQDTSAGTKSAVFSVSIAMKHDSVPAGQAPLVMLTQTNISKHAILLENGLPARVHILGEKGEPPKTYYYRQLLHEPGLPGLVDGPGGFTHLDIPGEKPYHDEGIPPGGSVVSIHDLKMMYDLVPGKYTVFLEVQDLSGVWLRTNTVHFEILSPTQ